MHMMTWRLLHGIWGLEVYDPSARADSLLDTTCIESVREYTKFETHPPP